MSLRSKKVQKRSIEDPCLLERVVSTVLGDGAQSLAGKLHADVTTAATIELRYPNALLLKVGVYRAVHSLSNVTTDTALLLGKTGAMNAAAFVRHGKRDIADSGHKIFVRFKFSGALFYTIFSPRQAKPLIFSKKVSSPSPLYTDYTLRTPTKSRVFSYNGAFCLQFRSKSPETITQRTGQRIFDVS